ncbi:MAG: hypothetical protein OJF52_002619 [Nitrospira sp.]|nr:MAG: hypothetical protein OJF52_002619 [Nitrospira sp.]
MAPFYRGGRSGSRKNLEADWISLPPWDGNGKEYSLGARNRRIDQASLPSSMRKMDGE